MDNSIFEKQKPDPNAWLVSYSDMVTLLLAFFVVLLSLSTIDQAKVEQFEQGISAVLLKKEAKKPFASVKDDISKMVEEQGISHDVSVNTDPLGVRLEFSSGVLYESGSADIKPEMIHILKNVANTIQNFSDLDYMVKVEGHTDNVPIQTEQFPSNWELSASRATTIVRHLIHFGIDKASLMAIGLADSQPKAPNTDTNGVSIPSNQAENRRVTVYIHRR